MYRLLCYNHSAELEPVEMLPAAGTTDFFACPRCQNRVRLLMQAEGAVARKGQTDDQIFNKLVASNGPESLVNQFGLVKEGSIFVSPRAVASEYVGHPELWNFLEEYVRRYEAAEISSFMELWDEEAVQYTDSVLVNQNQEQSSRVTIARNYTRLFLRIGFNRYQLTLNEISATPDHFQVEGVYRIEYPAGSPTPSYYAGMITLNLKRLPDQLPKIETLRFQPITFA